MTTLPALSLHQPWATLCVTRQPDPTREVYPDLPPKQMVKRFETRSFPAPQRLVGQRILIHAALTTTHFGEPPGGTFSNGQASLRVGRFEALRWGRNVRMEDADGGEHPLPLGAIVGSAVLGEPLPIVASDPFTPQYPRGRVIEVTGPSSAPSLYLGEAREGQWSLANVLENISDQLPYGDWTPSRFAWPLHDAAPTTERCPYCQGDGLDLYSTMPPPCPVCRGVGHCDPIPAKGHQQIGWPCDLEALVTT